MGRRLRRLLYELAGVAIVVGISLGLLTLIAAALGIDPVRYITTLAKGLLYFLALFGLVVAVLLPGLYIRAILEEKFPDRPPEQ